MSDWLLEIIESKNCEIYLEGQILEQLEILQVQML